MENIKVTNETLNQDIYRLINQVWKLIPMRENNENWQKQIKNVLIELQGLQSLFGSQLNFLIAITQLKGLLEHDDIDFPQFRSTIFSTINLINKNKQ